MLRRSWQGSACLASSFLPSHTCSYVTAASREWFAGIKCENGAGKVDMGKQPSVETLFKREQALCRKLKKQVADLFDDREQYRARVAKAEQELAEWKQRFDKLLERSPETQPTEGGK